MNMMRSSLKIGYNKIASYRDDLAKQKAREIAVYEGKEEAEWPKYYKKPKPLLAGLATEEGLITHFAALQKGRLGAGYIQSSEIGSELLSNANMVNIVKAISIGYDLGKIPAKLIKSDESQTEEVTGLPISALFFGSEDGILYEEAVKSKFKTIFSTQLARRSLFSFNPEVMEPIEFTTVDELIKYRAEQADAAIAAQTEISRLTTSLVETTTTEPLKIPAEVQGLFDVYKEYNSLEADKTSKLYPMTAIARRHLQWKALKLAGAYAILNSNINITKEDYIAAINTVELFAEDLTLFEEELRKEAYEMFVDYMKYIAEDGKATIGIHKLRKMGYIPAGSSVGKLKELVAFASSFDPDAIYTANDKQIYYEAIQCTDITGASWLPSEGTKDERKSKCNTGYTYSETSFNNLSNLLNSDLAFSPFEFNKGERGKDNIVGGTKWICLDVDNSTITDEELHYMLQDINHHIARTSDVNNAFKFRVILEFDGVVTVPANIWKALVKVIGDYINVKADLLPQSSIFFGYKDRTVLSVTDKDTLATKEHLMIAYSAATAKTEDISKLPKKQREALLSSPYTTFEYAYEAKQGTGSLKLISAAYHAKKLGATNDEVVELIRKINEYWDSPMSEQRLENTIISQIKRM